MIFPLFLLCFLYFLVDPTLHTLPFFSSNVFPGPAFLSAFLHCFCFVSRFSFLALPFPPLLAPPPPLDFPAFSPFFCLAVSIEKRSSQAIKHTKAFCTPRRKRNGQFRGGLQRGIGVWWVVLGGRRGEGGGRIWRWSEVGSTNNVAKINGWQTRELSCKTAIWIIACLKGEYTRRKCT